MAILGIESVEFGVDDLTRCTQFWSDFGLNLVSQDAGESVFDVPSGSRVFVRRGDDARLPPRNFEGNGVRRTVWGVDTHANLERLAGRLAGAVEITRDPDGTVLFQAPDGQYCGLRVWVKRRVLSAPDAVNAPDNIKRLNQWRQWRRRAIPKTINHAVFFSPDYVGSFEFYRDYLDFRYTDHSKGLGIFARADGTNEHHSIFWVSCDLPFAPDSHGFMHIAFGMDDIDEVMLGANTMDRLGWKNTGENVAGIARHRISSAIYYYVKNPNGGEAEYHADTDYLDDNWVPRAWDFKFGSLLWAAQVPTIFQGEDIPWDVSYDLDQRSFEPYRKPSPNPDAKSFAALTPKEEPAI